jgi:hypothetical protein
MSRPMKKLYHPTSNTLSIQIEDLISLSSFIRKVYVNEQKIINLSHYQDELILSAS